MSLSPHSGHNIKRGMQTSKMLRREGSAVSIIGQRTNDR
jgi:hypothetical protein